VIAIVMPEYMIALRLPNQIELQDIINCISPEVDSFFWIFSETIFSHESSDGEIFHDWDKHYERLFIEELPVENPHFRLSYQGFLNKYAKFILADWTEIYGLKSKVALSDVTDSKGWNIDKSKINEISEIIFCNVDAAFWIVKSENQSLLDRIKNEFPASIYISEEIY
jgi:hypothetical protein